MKFITSEKDRFLNPIGNVISEGIDVIFDFLVDEKDKDIAINALEGIIRIMALQDIMPSKAVSWVFDLKEILKKKLEKDDVYSQELYAIFYKIDTLMLMAFDIYMQCKEDINRIRIKEQMAKTMGMDALRKVDR